MARLRLGGRSGRAGRCPRPRVNPRTGTKTKYLGHRVPDVAGPGLDHPSEYRGILREILRDYRSGCISRETAVGRLRLLLRLTYPSRNRKAARIPAEERRRLREEIRRALQRIEG